MRRGPEKEENGSDYVSFQLCGKLTKHVSADRVPACIRNVLPWLSDHTASILRADDGGSTESWPSE